LKNSSAGTEVCTALIESPWGQHRPAEVGSASGTDGCEGDGEWTVDVVFEETVPPGTDKPEYFRFSVVATGKSEGNPVLLRALADGDEIEEGAILSTTRAVPPFEAALDIHFSLFDPSAPSPMLEARCGADVCWIPIEFPR